jgi:hypothetical protein
MRDSDRPSRRSTTAGAILRGTLSAGLLDLTFAFAYWGLHGAGPARVLQGVATGLLGKDAWAGGAPAAALGLLLFWIIIAAAAAVYVLAAGRAGLLRRRPLPCGLLYGAGVNLVMTFVVMPLSAAPPSAMALSQRLVVMLGCAVCIGLPIALAARRVGSAGGREPARARGRLSLWNEAH